MGKEKKEKIIYVDDGRSVADMSNVRPGISGSKRTFGESRSKLKDVWNTYWNATKMMLLPTLAIAGGLAVVYLIMALIFWLA